MPTLLPAMQAEIDSEYLSKIHHKNQAQNKKYSKHAGAAV